LTKEIILEGSHAKNHDEHDQQVQASAGYDHLPRDPNPRARVSSMHHLMHACHHTKEINENVLHPF